MCVCVHVSMLHCVHAYYLRRVGKKSDDPELELLASLTYHVDAENHTYVICKSCMYSKATVNFYLYS